MRADARGTALAKSDRAAAEATMVKHMKVPEKYLARPTRRTCPAGRSTAGCRVKRT